MIARQTGKRPLAAALAVLVLGAGTLILGQGCPSPTLPADGVSGDGFKDYWGAQYKGARARPSGHRRHGRPQQRDLTAQILHWNQIAIDASGLDHTPVAPGENRVFGEQFGPCRAARAMAIIHIAMFDALNASAGGKYQSYTGLPPFDGAASMHIAIAQAMHNTLAALFPSQAASFDSALAEDLDATPDGEAKTNGIQLGQQAAAAILTLRADDGSQYTEPLVGSEYPTGDEPGQWRQDPISMIPIALGAYWGGATPFVIRSSDQFRAPPPPPLDSPEYAAAFNEVKRLGGDGIVTPTERTADQTIAGIYWAYDGTPSLCAPPRLYNQIATHIADQMGTKGVEMARLLALVNTALADAALACWETKYYYKFWRPITGIREASRSTSSTGNGDGNRDTIGDPNWTPLGAPASNLEGPDFTPPFPAYTSGHAAIGASLFHTLRRFYETDDIAFTFVSDEYNGITQDNQGNVRPLIPRTFSSLSQAEEDNGQSRIYLGIHWSFDKAEGIAQGRKVADYVYDHMYKVRGPQEQ